MSSFDENAIRDALTTDPGCLRRLFLAADDAILVADQDRILDCNSSAESMFLADRRDLLAMRPADLLAITQPDGHASVELIRQTIAAALQGTAQRIEARHQRRDRTSFDAEVVFSRLDLGGRPHVLAVLRDVSAQRESERRLRSRERHLVRLNRVQRTLGELNRIILRETDADLLLRRACDLLVRDSDYTYVWFARIDESGHSARVRAASGPVPREIERFDLDSGRPGCATTCIATRRPVHIEPTEAEDPCPDCPALEHHPERSALALPMVRDGRCLGAMVVHAERGDVFDMEESTLLRDLADNLAYAMANLEAERERQRRTEALLALHETGVDLASRRDLGALLRAIVDRAERLLDTRLGGCYLVTNGELELAFADGPLKAVLGCRLAPGEGASGQACQTRRTVLVDDYTSWPGRAAVYEGMTIGSVIAAPMIWGNEVLGALHVEHPEIGRFGQLEVELVTLFAEQAAVAVANAQLFNDLERAAADLAVAYDSTLEGWVRALDMRDKETEGHTQRVTELAVQLARRFGINGSELVHVRRGALLHDIGKIGIPDHVLHKPGTLDDEEMRIIRRHTLLARAMLEPIPYLRPALDIPCHHHERWNGSGYPQGLSGEQIPLAARIFAVVDVWDALVSDRPYRAAWTAARVRQYLAEHAGTLFDPRVVTEFIAMIADGDGG